jgi:hypothetical protein
VLVTWFDQWMKGTMDSVQKQGTSVIVPPPIDISGVPE